ncbi:MAG: ABC transporter ATP-binding protein [Ilumatobacteraceae bacterium]|nr:ABC transporter ATP-binding protein [Ilumatobacteraceae bacterium]
MVLANELTPSVELIGITKTYPGVVANSDIHLTLRPGEVHSLLGENGAGKSTLIGILSGMVQPDAGEIRIKGETVRINSPRDALERGIGTVYQHSLLVPTLTVLDNLLLGVDQGWKLGRDAAKARLQEVSTLLDVEIDPSSVVGDLALGQRQQVEIVRALWRGEGVLILDEPTSMLTPQGAEKLVQVVRRLVSNGLAVVFITHKLNEALDLGDRVTVLRRGKIVGEVTPAELQNRSRAQITDEVLKMIFGEKSDASYAAFASQVSETADETFRVDHLSVEGSGPHPVLDNVSFTLKRGEILGIAGIDGNGQKELAEVLAGQRHADSGEIILDDQSIQNLSIAARQAKGIRYVTDDRHGEGTVGPLSIALNIVLKRVGEVPFWRWSLVRHSSIREFARKLIHDHDVRAPHEEVAISTLSGGNMQKVILARELALEPRVVVYNKPTYGLDARTTSLVLASIADQAKAGVTTVFISTELSEIVSICHRVAVMYRGKLSEPIMVRSGIELKLGALMTGSTTL